jgi:ABC-type transport system substrate-binding protein
MKHRVAAAAVAALAVWVFAGSAPAQTLVNIRTQDAPKYDPHNNTSSGMGHPMYMLGDTLVALDWDLKNVHPLLAKSWEVSPDGLTYIFKLRDDVTFCSGKKFTAADVVYSFKRLADPAAKWPFYWRLGEIDSITADDPYTVVYKLKRPHSELLVDLTNFAATIISKENVEALGADFGLKGFDGTGPLCWESWEPRKELVLKKHAAYKWGPTGVYKNPGPVMYDRMVWRIVPEETTRIATMLAGQADFCHWNPLRAIETFRKAPNLTVYEPDAFFTMYYYGIKSTREFMKDRRVRAALSHLIDRNEVNKAIFFARGRCGTLAGAREGARLQCGDARQADEVRSGALEEAARRGWLGDGQRRLPPQGRQEARAAVLLLRSARTRSCRRCCRAPHARSASTSRSRCGTRGCSSRRSRCRNTTSGPCRCPTPRPATRCISTITRTTDR